MLNLILTMFYSHRPDLCYPGADIAGIAFVIGLFIRDELKAYKIFGNIIFSGIH